MLLRQVEVDMYCDTLEGVTRSILSYKAGTCIEVLMLYASYGLKHTGEK